MNERNSFGFDGVGLTAFIAGVAFAQAPAGSTGECKDGNLNVRFRLGLMLSPTGR